MINALLGAPGGGKSYEAVVYHILPALKAGRLVITNLPLSTEYIYSVMPEAIGLIKLVYPNKENPIPFATLVDYGDPWRHPESGIGPLYVIDECHKAMPRGRTRLDVEEWYAEHRHEHADVLLLTQSYGKISRPVVDLFQLVYRVRKNVALGSNKSYVKKVQDGIRGEVVNTTIRRYDPAYYKFYKSHTKSDTGAEEAYASDVRPFWQHWSVIGAGICLLLVIYLGAQGKFNIFENIKQQSRLPTKPAASAIPRPPAVSPVTSTRLPHPERKEGQGRGEKGADTLEPTHPFYKVEMHIAGYVSSGKQTMYNIVASQNGQPQFEMNSNDLLLAGYKLTVITACSLKIQYGPFSDYLTCDSPRVSMAMADGSGGYTSRPSPVSLQPDISEQKTLVVGTDTASPGNHDYKSIYASK